MIKKLRKRFVITSLLSIFFVLLVTISAINISNYVMAENSASDSLNMITNQGMNPGMGPGGDQGRGDLRQEHYFVVSFNSDGTIAARDYRQMFAYTEAQCDELATKVFANELTGGRIDTLRYRKTLKNDGRTYVGFVDIKERLDSVSNFLLVSSLVSVMAYLVLTGLVLIAARIVFKPSEEAYKKQKKFITNASHELKTPLTVISADLDILEMDNGKNEWTESMRDQVKRLTEMTNQLVTLSRLEEEDASFPFEDFRLDEACEEAVESFKASFQKEGIEFTSSIDPNITMRGNRRLIEELLSVFLDNSRKYTGGKAKKSELSLNKTSKGQTELRFSNTLEEGDEVDPKQVLDRFYRSPSTKKEGSGIGLSVAQEIVALHKGNIQVEKNENTISFIIRFR